MTEAQFGVAINAARIRFLETLSLMMLESFFVDEDRDMVLNAFILKKRTEKP